MFPLGIIPALLGMALFYGYLHDKDEVNRYLFLFLAFASFTGACFINSEIASIGIDGVYLYQPDATLVAFGTAMGYVFLVFIVVLMVRLAIPAVWDALTSVFK